MAVGRKARPAWPAGPRAGAAPGPVRRGDRPCHAERRTGRCKRI